MKTVKLLAFFIIVTFNSYGQNSTAGYTTQGNFLVSAGMNFNLLSNLSQSNDRESVDAINEFSFLITPKAAYFVSDNFALGVLLDLEFGQTGDEALFDGSPVERTNAAYAVGPFARYYLDSGFFGEAGFGFGTTNVLAGTNATNQSPLFEYAIGIGYALFLNDTFSIEPLAQYRYNSVSNKNVNFNLVTTGIYVGVGFSAYL